MRARAARSAGSILTVAILAGCGGDGAGGGALEPATEQCVTGLWIEPLAPGGCPSCESGLPQYQTSECGRDDCVEAGGMLYRPDGSASTFTGRWSASAGTASVVLGCSTARDDSSWEVSEEGEILRFFDDGRDTSTDALCTEGHLQTRGYQEWERAPAGLEAVLASMPEREDCEGVPYEP
mgnify:CR=1 FL=1